MCTARYIGFIHRGTVGRLHWEIQSKSDRSFVISRRAAQQNTFSVARLSQPATQWHCRRFPPWLLFDKYLRDVRFLRAPSSSVALSLDRRPPARPSVLTPPRYYSSSALVLPKDCAALFHIPHTESISVQLKAAVMKWMKGRAGVGSSSISSTWVSGIQMRIDPLTCRRRKAQTDAFVRNKKTTLLLLHFFVAQATTDMVACCSHSSPPGRIRVSFPFFVSSKTSLVKNLV